MNEKGFTFPVTLCILLLFITFFSLHIEQFVAEKKFLHEIERFERNQFLFVQTIKLIEERLQEENEEPGYFQFADASVSYNVYEVEEGLLKIDIVITSEMDRREAMGMAWFNKELKKMTKWVERN